MKHKIPKQIVNPGCYKSFYFEPGEIYNLLSIRFKENAYESEIIPPSMDSQVVLANFQILEPDVRKYDGPDFLTYNGYWGYLQNTSGGSKLVGNRLYDLFLPDFEYAKFINFDARVLPTDHMVFLDVITHSDRQNGIFNFKTPITLTKELQFYNTRTQKAFSIFPTIQDFRFRKFELHPNKKPKGKVR